MKTCAIISEYNPFHKGHQYQIQKIRQELGEDTAIIAIMSGNFTQRAEVAITDKRSRAIACVLGGVNLVLELPFPHCMSSAEYFASSAVHIINSLGFIDYLSFGSESGDIKQLSEVAHAMLSERFKDAFDALKDDSIGYAKAHELALKSSYPKLSFTHTPNNILAIEYLKALIKSNSTVIPHTVKREGLGYNESEGRKDQLPSASFVRNLLTNGDSIEPSVPAECFSIYNKAYSNGDMPTDINRISSAIISFFRLNPTPYEALADLGDGLYYRLRQNSFEANDIPTLLRLTKTKKYTDAKIRRDMLYAFFGVTSSDKCTYPHYTQLLAMDNVGKSLLHSFARKSKITILTKPSSYEKLDEVARKQKALTERADAIFELTKPSPKSGKSSVRTSPFIK